MSRGTRKIGIRVSLGAESGKVMRLMLKQGGMFAGVGVVLGLGLAAIAGQLLQSLLWHQRHRSGDVRPYIPARRTLAVDPMVALRNE